MKMEFRCALIGKKSGKIGINKKNISIVQDNKIAMTCVI